MSSALKKLGHTVKDAAGSAAGSVRRPRSNSKRDKRRSQLSSSSGGDEEQEDYG